MNTQVLCGDLATNVGLKKEGATVLIRNPLLYLVAGARFGLWTRPALEFEFLLAY